MSNFITLEEAIQMTTLYRREKENILSEAYKGKNILVFSETFERESFDAILTEGDCAFVRIYYGMSEDLKIHAIGVGVNSQGEDILPAEGILPAYDTISTARTNVLADHPPVIIDKAQRCPDQCGPGSPLNP